MMRTIAGLVVTVILTSSAGAAAADGPIDVDLRSYRAATGTGSVAVRAYQEPKRPTGSNAPLTDVTVVLVPRSPALLERLAKIKLGARDSLARYRAAATEVRRTQEEFVKSVAAAGDETLVRQGTVDDAGAIALSDVPPGDWILLARRTVFVDKPSGTTSRREQKIYTLSKPLDGFREVTVWMRELSLGAGGREAVELTDRNVWFSGVEEVTRTSPGR